MARNGDIRTIYVLLTDTGTWFTRAIRLYTGAPWNHASLSLDGSLRDTYSFGRKTASNPFSAGFVREDLHSRLFRDASCCLLRCRVTADQYARLRAAVRDMEEHAYRYSYNLLGLLGLILNVRIEREHTFFCTEFVADLFERSGSPLFGKASCFATPHDLLHSPRLEKVYSGSLRAYLEGTVDTASSRNEAMAM